MVIAVFFPKLAKNTPVRGPKFRLPFILCKWDFGEGPSGQLRGLHVENKRIRLEPRIPVKNVETYLNRSLLSFCVMYRRTNRIKRGHSLTISNLVVRKGPREQCSVPYVKTFSVLHLNAVW